MEISLKKKKKKKIDGSLFYMFCNLLLDQFFREIFMLLQRIVGYVTEIYFLHSKPI